MLRGGKTKKSLSVRLTIFLFVGLIWAAFMIWYFVLPHSLAPTTSRSAAGLAKSELPIVFDNVRPKPQAAPEAAPPVTPPPPSEAELLRRQQEEQAAARR